ncbi:MAG: hypothetical protein ACT4OZ_17655 [Gemmatimonadota bacterium]
MSACVSPRAPVITGIPHTGPIPATSLAPGHARLIFRWDYDDPFFSARGEGVARIAPPDSVRIDYFLDGGAGGGGAAVMIGDSVATPPEADGRRYLPPGPLLWAALGVLRITETDTVARLRSDTLWVDLGTGPAWRAAFAGDGLVLVERIEGGRRREMVRRDSLTILYQQFSSRRRLTLTALRRVPEGPFDPSIWKPGPDSGPALGSWMLLPHVERRGSPVFNQDGGSNSVRERNAIP